MKTLALGIGNPILTDDSVGIKVAHRLAEEVPELDAEEASEIGVVLLDFVPGYDKLLIIDSIKTEGGEVGDVYKLGMEDINYGEGFSMSSHGMDIATAFELGRQLGYEMPDEIRIYAIEVKDNEKFGEDLSREMESRMPDIIGQIIREEAL